VVVLLVDAVADVGRGGVEALAAIDLHRLRHFADLQDDVVAEDVSGAELDTGDDGLLESAEADADRIRPEHERAARVGAGMIGGEGALDTGGFVPHGDVGAGQRRSLGVGDDAADRPAVRALGEKRRARPERQGEDYERTADPHIYWKFSIIITLIMSAAVA
jgi:hypothetical protein